MTATAFPTGVRQGFDDGPNLRVRPSALKREVVVLRQLRDLSVGDLVAMLDVSGTMATRSFR